MKQQIETLKKIQDLSLTRAECVARGDQVHADALTQEIEALVATLDPRMRALYNEMEAQKTMEAKIYKSLDKLEAVIQHNESPLSTWEENEFELNKTYAVDFVKFSPWLTALRQEILNDTIDKIENEK